jgi:RimJ/RimL family protein N-acetyltransferase
VEPVEINAGTYYLRQLRADALIDDRPAVLTAFADPQMRRWVPGYDVPDLAAAGRYVATRAEQWRSDQRYSWAVADPLTGNALGEVGLKNLDVAAGTAEASCWAHPTHRGRGVVVTALTAVLRFGFGALGLRHVEYQHAAGNDASRRVAEKCGFTLDRRIREGILVGGVPHDMLVWFLRADHDDARP